VLSETISLVSVILALVAVSVSAWQARFNMQHATRSRSLPVITEIFKEFRSKEFRASINNLLTLPSDKTTIDSLSALPEDQQEDAYKVFYFFDYIGTLVAFGIIREDIIITTMGNRIMQVWSVMLPIIEKERAYRSKAYPSNASPGFLIFYDYLVTRIETLGGREAAGIIQRRMGVSRPSAAADHEDPGAPSA
jgi:hypothetical protein